MFGFFVLLVLFILRLFKFVERLFLCVVSNCSECVLCVFDLSTTLTQLCWASVSIRAMVAASLFTLASIDLLVWFAPKRAQPLGRDNAKSSTPCSMRCLLRALRHRKKSKIETNKEIEHYQNKSPQKQTSKTYENRDSQIKNKSKQKSERLKNIEN